MSEFTPGPWKVGGRFSYDTADSSQMYQFNVIGTIGGAPARTIAEVGEWRDRPNAEADAHLIAAAPELYRELKYAVMDMSLAAEDLDATYHDDTSKGLRKIIHNANLCLAKARGETG